jgi:mannose-6-phosphate isomerase-like protein (cupin superfamily)
MKGIRVLQARERPVGEQSAGMVREQAFTGEGVWVGRFRTPAGSVGGWHHHGDNDRYFYIVKGRARVEWGVGGRERVDLKPGDFVHIPANTVHRELNPGSLPNLGVLFRKGVGPTVVPADPP